eukprot:gene18320-biopygen18959
MGLGPHPVERARSGGAEGARGPAQRRPHRRGRRPTGPHMSGVGAPATRPRIFELARSKKNKPCPCHAMPCHAMPCHAMPRQCDGGPTPSHPISCTS